MPRYDLNGNPMDDPDPAPTPVAATVAPVQQYDLAGNPLPLPQAPPPSPYGQPPGQAAPYGAPPQPGYGAPPQGQYADGRDYRYVGSKAGSGLSDNARLGLASALGLVIAIIGSIIVMKIAFYVGIGFSILYIALGWGVGYVLGTATENKGGACLAGALVLSIGLFIGHITYTMDVVNKFPELLGGMPLMTAFPIAMKLFKFTHWLFVAAAFMGCMRGAAAEYGGQ